VNNELVIDVSTPDISIALLEDKKLIEVNKERSDIKFSVGDIYLGKVKRIMPGLNAAFVDVGYEKDAFLHYHDLGPQFRSLQKFLKTMLMGKGKPVNLSKFRCEHDINKDGKITDVIASGQLVAVQIAKEPISTKGPRLTSEISIPGRNLVLIPFADKVSVSTKIESAEERNRLKTLLQSIKPKNYGVIVRTVAETKKVAELDTELRGLIRKFETAFDHLKDANQPRIILSELKRTSAILRDILNVSFNTITVNDESMYKDIREYISTIAPEKEKIVKLYEGKEPIFEHFGVEKQIKSSFGKTVSFKSGAYLVIEHTEALHVIDVNSGNRSKSAKDQETNALETNLAAADEIARQLRLRDMGGIIVVDFIDMHSNEHKNLVFEKMKENMSRDRTKHNILPLSKFGVMQITRQRVRPEMKIETLDKCPTCGGTGEIKSPILMIDQIENVFHTVAENSGKGGLTLKTHPFIAAFLRRGLPSLRMRWSFRHHCRLRVEAVNAYNFLEFHFFNKEGDEVNV
jgi:ribonuclease G